MCNRFVVVSACLTAILGHGFADGRVGFLQPPADADSSRSGSPVGLLTQEFVRRSDNWGTRHLNATIWYPSTDERNTSRSPIADAPPSNRGPFPIIVYSHGGCGGSPEAIAPIAVAIARVGFVVVQFPHPGSKADDCAPDGDRYARALLERPDDIVYVLDEFRRLNAVQSWRLKGVVDGERVGIIGHSQGGQTALMMPVRDSRVKGSLSLPPSVAHRDTPPAVWRSIERADAAVMIVGGERDATWTSEGPLKAFNSLPRDVPRAFVEIHGMGHTPTTTDEIAIVLRYATAFFRYYVRGDTAARPLLEPAAAPRNVSFRSARFP